MRRLLFLVTTMLLMVQGASAWNGSGSSGDPYQITSTADWNTLASNVANGNTYSNTYFKLTADITVTTMVTATFSGTFDGGGNTLTFNYTATGNNAAPFAYITGATIKNLRVAGTINTGYKFAAGIAAECGTTTITNCQSSVTINSSVDGDGTHGGLIGCQGSGTLTINNCLFDGELMGAKTTGCGGFVGWVVNSSSYHTYISNSLFAPANITVNAPTFCRHKSSTLHLEASTCYYITPNWTASTVQGTNANSMTAAALVTALNNGDKNWCVHRGNAIPVMVNLVINNKTEWDNFSSHAGNYENKYVQLNADITNITAKISNAFQGIFDGNGHTLTVNLSGGGNMAPFQYLNGGTIMNLTVAGSVTSTDNFCSGLVARTSGGVCLIDNCVVNTNNDGVGFVGGVVAHADNATALTISNCIYGGTIAIQPNGNNENYSGGILGWYNNNQTLDLVMTNCLFKGDYTGNGLFHPIGVKKLDKIFKSSNCTNCYYTKNPANIDDAKRTFTDGTKVCELSLGDNIIATGSSCTFDGKTYHLGTVSLSYTPSKSTLFYMIDGNPNLISGNSFTISKDNQAFDAGAVTITAGDTSITYDYGGTNNTILYIDVNNENSNMVTHPWTSEANYSSITSVVIGNGVTSICGKAFAVCPNLTSVSIASTVESIDAEAFSECGKLETVTFTNANESQLTDILPNAFANLLGMQIIYVEEHDNGRYEGDIKEGKREGYGKYYYSTGDIYEGEFKNNLKNGKGKYIYCNKDIYEGEYKDGKIHGLGKYLYIEGDSYEGEYKNGHRDGQGTYIYANGNKYEGRWKEGKKNGFGIYYYSDNSRYEGQYVNGKKEGKGRYICFNGDVYEGEYKNDKREGYGIFTFKGGDKYEGEFKNNFFEGKGKYNYKNGNIYEGEFYQDLFHGKGIFYFKDGDKYEGDWKNDLKDGHGIYTYSNGNVYDGEYKDDHAEGHGIFYHKNGNKNEGEFKNGRPVGIHVKTLANGVVKHIKFK